MDDRQPLACPSCLSPFPQSRETEVIRCGTCDAVYPVVAGLPILHCHPNSLLGVWTKEIERSGRKLRGGQKLFAAKRRIYPVPVQERSDRILESRLKNQELVEDVWQPVKEYLDHIGHTPDLMDGVLNLQSGWSIEGMLPYFLQDWGSGDALQRLSELCRDAVDRYLERPPVAAVLGCGAGGLLHRLAPSCERAFGLDLALPILLLAGRVLEGGSLGYVHASSDTAADFSSVDVHGPADPAENLALIGGDVNVLPFASGQLSMVTTQFLLDIVPNSTHLATEINRVLCDGGIWVNFGPPFKVHGDPPLYRSRNHEDTAPFLDDRGFEALQIERERVPFLDSAEEVEWSQRVELAPLFFVARKRETRSSWEDQFAAYFGEQDRAILDIRPRLASGRSIGLLKGRTFAQGKAIDDSWQILVEGARPRPLPPAVAGFYNSLLAAIRNESTLSEIIDQFARAARLDEAGMVRLFRVLSHAGLVELGGDRSTPVPPIVVPGVRG
jgi:hypothetical protein